MASKVSTIVKPYLKKLVLQTHPDFFRRHPAQGKVNAASLQKLNALLLPVIQDRHPPQGQDPVQLEFYSKSNLKHAMHAMDPGQPVWETVQSFFNLCEKLDVRIQDTDALAVKHMVKQTKPQRRRQFKTLGQEFAEALRRQGSVSMEKENPWTPARVLDNRLLMFDSDVDQKKAAHHLSKWLAQLQPEQWWGRVPVLVVSVNNVPHELTRGMIVLTPTMSYQEMKHALERFFQEEQHG